MLPEAGASMACVLHTLAQAWLAYSIRRPPREERLSDWTGALLFGLAEALQFRIQALNITVIPYELLLMLPYVLTLVVLLRRGGRSATPAALGQ